MPDRKQTKTIGEHFACANLARHGWAPALVRDGLERTDILAVGSQLPGRPVVEVQVKTATGGAPSTSWMLGAKSQLPSRSTYEWFILVAVPPWPAPMRSFIVPRDHVAAAAWIVHLNWLHDPNAKPGSRNAGVDRARVPLPVFERYEDRWELLTNPTGRTPVLLPSWIREASLRPDVGLPPGHPWRAGLPLW